MPMSSFRQLSADRRRRTGQSRRRAAKLFQVCLLLIVASVTISLDSITLGYVIPTVLTEIISGLLVGVRGERGEERRTEPPAAE
jgi:hypothetical protein